MLEERNISIKEHPLLKKVRVAKTFFERAKGLIGTKDMSPYEGMLIERCNAIHTFFMSFPIDAYFFDKKNRLVKVVKNIKPWKTLVFGGFKASYVIEVKSSPLEKTFKL
jgi:uncharacterized membrane protein (UPF0127 family)